MNSAPLPLLDALLAAVSDADSLPSLLDRALAQVRAAIGAATASIYLGGTEHPQLVALQGCDAFGQELNQAAETAGARQRDPTPPNQAPNDPRVRCLPLDTPQQTLGWLCLAFASTAPTPPADDDLLRTAARIIALGIARIRDAERLRAQLHGPAAPPGVDRPTGAGRGPRPQQSVAGHYRIRPVAPDRR